MIGILTDGDGTMIGHINGVVTRLEKILGSGAVRVWCGLNQLDIMMKSLFEAAFDELFLSKKKNIIGYLWHQKNLLASM